MNNESVVFTFGRFNPPTRGHQKVIDTVLKTATTKNAVARVFPSHSQDPERNPLSYVTKHKCMVELFPNVNVVCDPEMKNPFIILKALSDAGYKNVTFVVGSDRFAYFDEQIRKYIKHEDPKKSLEFDSFEVINAGEREGEISASLMRAYATDDDFTSFKKGLPSTATDKMAQSIFNSVRKGMNVS